MNLSFIFLTLTFRAECCPPRPVNRNIRRIYIQTPALACTQPNPGDVNSPAISQIPMRSCNNSVRIRKIICCFRADVSWLQKLMTNTMRKSNYCAKFRLATQTTS